ncbi:hypothetical protein Tco_0218120 [Tanacetum coccineum]
MESQSETTQTMYALKFPVLKTKDYDIWNMRMEQYLTHPDYALWDIIVNADAPDVALASAEAPVEVSWNQGCKDPVGHYQDQEDANLKLLRSLPSSWNNIALIMRNKTDLDRLSMRNKSSTSNSQNVAFVSSDDTSSTNEAVNTALDVPAARSKGQASSSTYADDVIDGSLMAGGHTYHEGEEILKEDMKESEFQWQRNCWL